MQQELERLSSEAAKYGTTKVLKRTARAKIPLRVSGARPSWGPHPGLPWPQRPLQEDQSRYAENQPSTDYPSHRKVGNLLPACDWLYIAAPRGGAESLDMRGSRALFCLAVYRFESTLYTLVCTAKCKRAT